MRVKLAIVNSNSIPPVRSHTHPRYRALNNSFTGPYNGYQVPDGHAHHIHPFVIMMENSLITTIWQIYHLTTIINFIGATKNLLLLACILFERIVPKDFIPIVKTIKLIYIQNIQSSLIFLCPSYQSQSVYLGPSHSLALSISVTLSLSLCHSFPFWPSLTYQNEASKRNLKSEGIE